MSSTPLTQVFEMVYTQIKVTFLKGPARVFRDQVGRDDGEAVPEHVSGLREQGVGHDLHDEAPAVGKAERE